MKASRSISRRSFLATVAGSAIAGGGALAATGAGAFQTSDRDPSDPIGRGRGGGSGVTDNDPSDPVGRGRGGNRGGSTQRSGVTDGDPSDPIGNGRGGGRGGTRTGITDSDPTDPVGNAPRGHRERGATGCSDSDPTDRAASGRNCRPSASGNRDAETAYQTGRRERRYEVCWVDHPNRSNADCNIQTYSEWATTWSDGRVEYDTAESARRRAEMEARGYTARWHRMLVNEW